MDPLFLFAALLAEIVGTMAGFGSSTAALPVALFFFDFPTALLIVALLHIFGNIGRIGWFRHGLDRKLLFTFGIPSVVASLIGALIVPLIPQTILKGLLGVFLVGYAGFSLWKDVLIFKASTGTAVTGGALSGFIAGLIGTGGAIRGVFLNAFNLKKERYIATAAAIAIAVDLTRIPVYLNQSPLKAEYYPWLVVLFFIALLGSWLGRWAVQRIPQKLFRKWIFIALLLIGLYFIGTWWRT